MKEEEFFYLWKVSKFLPVAFFAKARRVDLSKFHVENKAILRIIAVFARNWSGADPNFAPFR